MDTTGICLFSSRRNTTVPWNKKCWTLVLWWYLGYGANRQDLTLDHGKDIVLHVCQHVGLVVGYTQYNRWKDLEHKEREVSVQSVAGHAKQVRGKVACAPNSLPWAPFLGSFLRRPACVCVAAQVETTTCLHLSFRGCPQ